LGQLISEETLLYFLNICDRFDCKSLEAACGAHLAENFEKFEASGRLDLLEASTWAEMLKRYPQHTIYFQIKLIYFFAISDELQASYVNYP